MNINIVPFKFKHLPLLHEMLKSQQYIGISDIKMKTLPKIGYIALLNSQPIAAGFLRRVEPCFAQLDTLTSNAYFGSAVRNEGVQLVVDTLIEEAKRIKISGILALTSDSGILTRAKVMGFHEVEQKVIALPLIKT